MRVLLNQILDQSVSMRVCGGQIDVPWCRLPAHNPSWFNQSPCV